MQISQDTTQGPHINSYATGQVTIDKTCYQHNVIVTMDSIMAWKVSQFTDLNTTNLQVLLQYDAELIIIGYGAEQGFLPSELLLQCQQHRVGVEVMNTGAACRTYNILRAEERKVVSGLIV